MMKKMCLLICCVLILQMLCSCAGKKEEYQEPVNFYYCNHEISYNSVSGVIQAEVREGSGFSDNLAAFLHAYLLGPEDSELQSPVPSDVYLVSCSMEDDTVNIVLSSQFSKLTGVDLTTACSAILMSVHDFNGAQVLKISAKDEKIDDTNVFMLSMDDIVLIDTATTEE